MAHVNNRVVGLLQDDQSRLVFFGVHSLTPTSSVLVCQSCGEHNRLGVTDPARLAEFIRIQMETHAMMRHLPRAGGDGLTVFV